MSQCSCGNHGDTGGARKGQSTGKIGIAVQSGSCVGTDDGDQTQPNDRNEDEKHPMASGVSTCEYGRKAKPDECDGGERAAHQDNPDPNPRPPMTPFPQIMTSKDDEQCRNGLEVEVKEQSLVNPRIGHQCKEDHHGNAYGGPPRNPLLL